MLEDTNSLDGAHLILLLSHCDVFVKFWWACFKKKKLLELRIQLWLEVLTSKHLDSLGCPTDSQEVLGSILGTTTYLS